MSTPVGYNVIMTTTDTQTIAVLDKFRRPLRDLRISVTDRCNFRCTYCMPAEIFGERYEFLQKADLLTFEEIARLTRIFVDLGVVKVRLTGGEPLVRSEVEKLVSLLAGIDGIGDLTMTTNAYLLPQKATALRNAGLHRLSVSLDTLDDAIFREMNGRGFGVGRVLEGVTAAEEAGFTPIKVNAVVQRGVNDHTLVDLARYFRERGHIMRFIEYMDVGNLNGWKLDEVVSAEEIIARIDAEMPLEPAEANYRRDDSQPLSLQGRQRRNRRDRVRNAAFLRRLHAAAPFARRHALHLPVRCQWHGSADSNA